MHSAGHGARNDETVSYARGNGFREKEIADFEQSGSEETFSAWGGDFYLSRERRYLVG